MSCTSPDPRTACASCPDSADVKSVPAGVLENNLTKLMNENLDVLRCLAENCQGKNTVEWTVGDEATNVIEVTAQVQTPDGEDDTVASAYWAYFSDASTGLGYTGTAPDSGLTATTGDSVAVAPLYHVQTDATGTLVVDVEESSTGTWYLVLVMPDGSLEVSPAITFA